MTCIYCTPFLLFMLSLYKINIYQISVLCHLFSSFPLTGFTGFPHSGNIHQMLWNGTSLVFLLFDVTIIFKIKIVAFNLIRRYRIIGEGKTLQLQIN